MKVSAEILAGVVVGLFVVILIMGIRQELYTAAQGEFNTKVTGCIKALAGLDDKAIEFMKATPKTVTEDVPYIMERVRIDKGICESCAADEEYPGHLMFIIHTCEWGVKFVRVEDAAPCEP